MSSCKYCDCLDAGHLSGCPAELARKPYLADPVLLAEWERGRKAGKSGKQLPSSESATFRIGWLQGDRIADAAANGEL